MKSQPCDRFFLSAILSFSLFSVSIEVRAEDKAQPEIYVGFLEGEGPRRVFVLKSGTWQSALPDADSIEALNQERNIISEPKKWTVFFDGKVRTQLSVNPVKTVTLFKNLGLQQTAGKNPQLPVQKPDSQFSAFDGPRVRPYLLTTDSNVSDPDRWKPDAKIKCPPAAKAAFKQIFGAQANYDGSTDGEEPKKYLIEDKDIVLSKAYKTTAGTLGSRLIGLKLKLPINIKVSCETEGDRCEGAPTHWFYIPNEQKPIYLAKASALVETADLNSDGTSDFAFWVSEYNLGGYSIVDGKTRALIQAHWSYH
ncbi:MAG: hypothetical protein J0L82_03315 [Deltaproteobacteria bacterium]|nr:hypothetical protein [Deltaproteobacteria bacterium]